MNWIPRRLLPLFLGLGWLLCPPVFGASGFVVANAVTRLEEQTYLLDVQVDYGFSETALAALDNGVPLTLEMRVQVRRKGAWIWESNLVEQRRLYTIRYRPLPELYQVARLPEGPKQSFVTRAAAITALGEVHDLPLLDKSRLDPDERYLVRVKVSLDVEALPLPLRPLAYLKPSWDLSSGWSLWPLEP
jgi:hypothetical protein